MLRKPRNAQQDFTAIATVLLQNLAPIGQVRVIVVETATPSCLVGLATLERGDQAFQEIESETTRKHATPMLHRTNKSGRAETKNLKFSNQRTIDAG